MGQIAHKLGVKVGDVKGHGHAHKKHEHKHEHVKHNKHEHVKHHHDRPEFHRAKFERPERPTRPEKIERPQRRNGPSARKGTVSAAERGSGVQFAQAFCYAYFRLASQSFQRSHPGSLNKS